MYVKTIEVPDTVVSVTTDENYKYYWIRNLGEQVVGVFKNTPEGPLEGFHVFVNPRECVKVIPEGTTLYFGSVGEDTTNKIEIYGTNTVDCPFKTGKGKGGDGGGTLGIEEVVLWENEGTTNPQTITLSESYTNFDELVFECRHKTKSQLISSFYLANDISTNVQLYPMYGSESHYIQYSFVNSTTLNSVNNLGNFYFTKIIGRRYTRVNPTGYRQTVLWENTGTTNPDTIALSEAYTNFDEVMFCLNTNIANRGSASNTYLADDIIVGSDNLYGVELSAEIYVWYKCSSSTALALYVEGSQATLTKIIGIKYGSGGGSGQYSGTYTPEGAVAVTPTTGTVTGVSANGTLPAVTYDTANEELTFTAGTLPTLDTDKSFVTGATAEFTGTQAIITVQ